MIDPYSDTPAYQQLAAYFRDRIASGQLAPGNRLPSEAQIHQMTGLSRNTIRAGMRVLQNEGLVIIRPPHGTSVRELPPVWDVSLQPGDRAELRPSTSMERRRHGVNPVALMLHIHRHDGRSESGPAEGARILAPEAG